MGGINPIMMLLLMGKGALGGGLIKKVLMFSMFGMIGLLIGGGGMNIRDLIMVPMIAPMFAGMFGGTGAPTS